MTTFAVKYSLIFCWPSNKLLCNLKKLLKNAVIIDKNPKGKKLNWLSKIFSNKKFPVKNVKKIKKNPSIKVIVKRLLIPFCNKEWSSLNFIGIILIYIEYKA